MDLMTEEKRPKAAFRQWSSVAASSSLHTLVICLICREAQSRRERLIRMESTPTIMSRHLP